MKAKILALVLLAGVSAKAETYKYKCELINGDSVVSKSVELKNAWDQEVLLEKNGISYSIQRTAPQGMVHQIAILAIGTPDSKGMSHALYQARALLGQAVELDDQNGGTPTVVQCFPSQE